MPTRNVSLTVELDRWISEQVAAGVYENASEVVRAGLRALLRQDQLHQASLAAVRSGLDHGERSGIADGDPFQRIRGRLKLHAE
jgi:antitoxin ParD1/3/4